MSLYSAVFQTKQVPYRDVSYYGAITQPTPRLEGFMARVMRRLGTTQSATALFHLDQGMGGGKSHALIGLWHLAAHLDGFLATDLGQRVRTQAEELANGPVEPAGARVVVLSADHITPGAASPEYGPARTLFERFLWILFNGDEGPYDRYRALGPNKATLRRALEEVDRPVLILLDEIMDYALKLSGADFAATLLPDEQAFLADLMEAVAGVPRVAFVLVMIRSEADEHGYNEHAIGFREYISARVERNGMKLAVTEPQDFRAILNRRIFETPVEAPPTGALAAQWEQAASQAWRERAFDRLAGSRRGLNDFSARVASTYPFHPDLLSLVEDDWSRNTGFQRVRSTVRIFASAAHHWHREHHAGRWAPPLIGVGDIPLHTSVQEVLNSGLLRGNDRAIQSFRQVAAKDVISGGGEGNAVTLDVKLKDNNPVLAGQHPCLRMATALFLYSLVPRAGARSGATKPELLAAAFVPDTPLPYTDVEEAHSLLVHEEEGLGALDVLHGAGGNTPTRYLLSIQQTLRMFYRQARGQVQMPSEADDLIWDHAQRRIASKGRFDRIRYVDGPQPNQSLAEVFAEVDERTMNRLVVLDPHHWTLLNGEDGQTRHDIIELLGLGNVPVDNAASCVVACVNTQRRKRARDRALEVAAYDRVLRGLDPSSELRTEAELKLTDARKKLDREIEDAFQHYAYLVRGEQGVEVAWQRFDIESQTALNGNHVWDALVSKGRAARPGALSGAYLPNLIDVTKRPHTIREIVSRFWDDPTFPLVSSEGDLRRAIFEAVTQASLDADPPWQLVDENDEPLQPRSPDDLAIHSNRQIIRPYQAATTGDIADDGGETEDTGDGGGDDASTDEYKRYTVRLAPRSVTDDTARDRVSRLLLALSDALDVGGPDVQLAEISVTLTAAAGSLDDIKTKANDVGAHWTEEDEDF
jgi:Protein of unknown function (DUF499)